MATSETNISTETDYPASLQEAAVLQTTSRRMAGSRGFTLVELIIVLGIIGVLAVVATSGFTALKDNARVARAASEIRGLEKDISSYFIDKGSYPANYAALVLFLNKGELMDPWGHPYEYRLYVTGGVRFAGVIELSQDYDLYSKGKDGLSPDLSINDSDSEDDIIRAGNGSYVGTVKQYLN